MIRRPYKDGYLLIPQPAHAWLSGQLAQHWGNDEISIPEPKQAIVIATIMHDVGWLEKDGLPILNANKQPLNFIEPELDDVEEMYGRTVGYTMQVDPYAGILVNRHVQTIYRSRATHKRDPIERLHPLLDDLKIREQSSIKQLSRHPLYADFVDDIHLDHNHRILRTCDLLSLFVCGAFPAREVHDVPFQYRQQMQAIQCEMLDEHTLKVTPNLFDCDKISVHLQARVIEGKRFETQTDYKEAFDRASFTTLTKTIIGA